MCVVSSPYIEWYAQVLREAAAYDLDGFFFDGFYLGGIPHPSRSGCVCKFCEEAFRKDTGLALPNKVDWSDMTFKRWVRWRNERLLRTARYFQSEMRKINPRLTCTFNYNMWPFARKDWETAIPAWRIDDFGVSQHGYSGKFEEKWLLMGFKARIGRDINPAHTDMWRASSMDTTCGKGKSDLAWYEHEIKTFMLCGLSYGITPWHAPAVSADVTARIHAEIARRERYFSRDYVCNVGVVYSQNTHDFYGHIPDTENLNTYRDGILGTWMLLTENHVPFEFVFDNQIESGGFKKYQVLVLPNTAAISDRALREIAAWVRDGGRLIASAETAAFDEWGNKAAPDRLIRAVGKDRMTYLPGDPGLDFCRKRDHAPAAKLVAAIAETPMPFSVKAPNSLLVNMFHSPGNRELWVHLLNVSAFMPNGDNGFRGLDLPTAQVKDVGSDAQLAGEGQKIGGASIPAKDIVFSLPGKKVKSARLVIADKPLTPDEKGQLVIPVIDLHDTLVIQVEVP
jgi:SAM-dependent methyltransferase